jgi:tRNA threonylcarbamoyladenosine biosynthesis protein TsaB
MHILAIDSTAVTVSVALTEDFRLISQYSINKTLTHSETLLPMIRSMLDTARFNIGDIGMFACSAGPGSFTGVRIGVSTLKGLAFGTGKPCVGVSTLEALAYNLTDIDPDAIICPVMDARRGQVYNALFSCRTRLTPDRPVSLTALEEELKKYNTDIYIVGDGYNLAHEKIKLPHIRKTPEPLRYQNAYSVAAVALRKYMEEPGSYADTDLSPVYLRPSQAERERSAAECCGKNPMIKRMKE